MSSSKPTLLEPLLETLGKITDGRIIPEAHYTSVDDYNEAQIPIIRFEPEDRSETTLKRFAADWFRKRHEKFRVETRVRKFKGGAVWNDKTPVEGALIISWWTRPKSTMDEFKDSGNQPRRR
jgi:hypothetical protein